LPLPSPPALLRRLCTKAFLFEHGRIVASGGVDEVLQRYRGTSAQAGLTRPKAG
jgi:ABC-type polysaccharide/polyol phosphate transport system ATPase subunit